MRKFLTALLLISAPAYAVDYHYCQQFVDSEKGDPLFHIASSYFAHGGDLMLRTSLWGTGIKYYKDNGSTVLDAFNPYDRSGRVDENKITIDKTSDDPETYKVRQDYSSGRESSVVSMDLQVQDGICVPTARSVRNGSGYGQLIDITEKHALNDCVKNLKDRAVDVAKLDSNSTKTYCPGFESVAKMFSDRNLDLLNHRIEPAPATNASNSGQ